jgi:hypothetical protein
MIVPKLATDFALAVLDPRITFARSLNTATRINASGLLEVVNADTPRFDYSGSSVGICLGLLIEEARTNTSTYSEDFSTWGTPTNASVSTDFANAPNGVQTADKLISNVGATDGRIVRNYTTVAGTAYSFSVFCKADGITSLNIVTNIAGSFVNNTFNLTTGAAAAGANITVNVRQLQNGYFRCTVSGTASVTTTQIQLRANGTGNGANGILLWGSQFEVGSFPTSYIPNLTTGTTTRNADVATITGTNFSSFWQAGRGGVLVRALPSTVSGTRPLVQFDDNTADNLIVLQGNTTDPELYIVDSTTPQAQIDAGTIAAGTPYTLTGWWQTDFCAARLNNSARVEDLTATIPTVTQARLGSDGTNYLNGHLATINYYDRFSGQIYTRRKNKAVFSVL